jgi:hypothetical protein
MDQVWNERIRERKWHPRVPTEREGTRQALTPLNNHKKTELTQKETAYQELVTKSVTPSLFQCGDLQMWRGT